MLPAQLPEERPKTSRQLMKRIVFVAWMTSWVARAVPFFVPLRSASIGVDASFAWDVVVKNQRLAVVAVGVVVSSSFVWVPIDRNRSCVFGWIEGEKEVQSGCLWKPWVAFGIPCFETLESCPVFLPIETWLCAPCGVPKSCAKKQKSEELCLVSDGPWQRHERYH